MSIISMQAAHALEKLGLDFAILRAIIPSEGGVMTKETFRPEDLMTAAQAADFLGIHFTTVHRWIRAGKFNLVRIGATDYLRKIEVEKHKGESDDSGIDKTATDIS